MAINKIETIIFDLGGVLIDWNPKYLYRKIFRTEEAVEYFLKNICTFEWNECQDGGRSISEANEILISKYPEYENEILSFYGRWTEMLGGEIPESVKLLMQIKESKKYQLVALTNWSAETFPMALERYNYLKCFENILVSGEEGVKKPDMTIYDLLCQKFNINPAKAIFIDDNERNIDAARSYGLNTILFNNTEDCKTELSKWIKLN